jgi:hypothetical protein
VVAVKVATQRLRVNGESTGNDDEDENENKANRTKQKLLGSEDAD